MKIYVAVVHKAWQRSGRPEGDWGSFVNKNKKAAIAAAIAARKKWEAKGFGPYQIWVGVLTEDLQIPVEYKLQDIVETKPAVTVPVSHPPIFRRSREGRYLDFDYEDHFGIN